jgi:hypothetical protein
MNTTHKISLKAATVDINNLAMNIINSTQKPFDQKEYQRQWYYKNKESLREANRESARRYYAKHGNTDVYKERQGKHARLNRSKNKDNPAYKALQRDRNIAYFTDPNNKDIIKEKVKERTKRRMKSDINYRMRCKLRRRIANALKHVSADKHFNTMELIGCTVQEARAYIESKWLSGMSWDNHSTNGWHIDHIMPCAAFDLSIPEQQKRCFHYTNLQPLWAYDNLSKGDRIIQSSVPQRDPQ